jgi:hypothetical protein
MAFNPKSLPSKVYEAYELGIGAWPLVVQIAVEKGISNPDRLTDIVFHLCHPELNGRDIVAGEESLVKEWKGWRANVNAVVGEFRTRTVPSREPIIQRWEKKQEIRTGP